MTDHAARGEDFEKKAEKKLNGWGLFGSKYEDAADLYDKAANSYKLAKSLGQSWINISQVGQLSFEEAVTCLKQAVNAFLDNGRISMAARYEKEIAELYEQEQNFEQAMMYYDKAGDLFQGEEVISTANQCRLKVAQYAAQEEQYQKAIEIYEDIARTSLNNNLLKYGVKGHLLNAGLCQLCKGDVVAITIALERYQELDPTFFRTREYKLLADIASAIDEEDVAKFTEVVKVFDSMTQLDSWKTTLLLRVKEKLKAKEMEEEDLT